MGAGVDHQYGRGAVTPCRYDQRRHRQFALGRPDQSVARSAPGRARASIGTSLWLPRAPPSPRHAVTSSAARFPTRRPPGQRDRANAAAMSFRDAPPGRRGRKLSGSTLYDFVAAPTSAPMFTSSLRAASRSTTGCSARRHRIQAAHLLDLFELSTDLLPADSEAAGTHFATSATSSNIVRGGFDHGPTYATMSRQRSQYTGSLHG